jgi:SP family myo-inositol transporter-like MFS transporter 13
MAFAPGFNTLVFGRFVVGLGVGSSSMTMPVYVSEMAPPDIRGSLVTCVNICVTGGQFISCLIAGSLSYTDEGWRYMLGLAALPAILQFIGFMRMPESPRWLIQNNEYETARRALQVIRGDEYSINELDSIASSIEAEKAECGDGSKSTLTYLMEDVALRRAVFLGCCLQAAQQFDGINTIMYVTYHLPISILHYSYTLYLYLL